MFCIPRFFTPMNPKFTRSFAPNARSGTKYGTANTAEAAAVVCRNRRRETVLDGEPEGVDIAAVLNVKKAETGEECIVIEGSAARHRRRLTHRENMVRSTGVRGTQALPPPYMSQAEVDDLQLSAPSNWMVSWNRT